MANDMQHWRPNSARRHERLVGAIVLAVVLLVPGHAFGLQINSAGDPALSGALLQDFDGTAADTFFGSQTFLIGIDGFTVTPLAADLHIDNVYCVQFGTSGNCLDTIDSGNAANDDFDVVFTGLGVSAFGFELTALDTDWTIETFDASDNLLSTYVIPSQSPGLTGFNRRGYFGATESVAIQYFTVRSAGDDRALIDDFSYVPFVLTPEPNTVILLGLGLLALAGTRYRTLDSAVDGTAATNLSPWSGGEVTSTDPTLSGPG